MRRAAAIGAASSRTAAECLTSWIRAPVSRRIASPAPPCSPATADALSTAFSVLAPHESVALADSLCDVGCLLVERDGTITTNATWNARAVAPRHVSLEESIDARLA